MTEEFVKYQHVERLGTDETQGIEIGDVYVFPKIDGSNSSLWWTVDDGIGRLHAASRNRELTLDNDNHGFFNWCVNQPQAEGFARFFRANPNHRLYGEWLRPHTLKTYVDDAWNNFYVFDVISDFGYMHYEDYKILLDAYGIKYIPPICRIKNPTYDRLIEMTQKNVYLIKEGQGVGEGIVIKNYDYRNKYGRVTWAKVVTNEFKGKHWGSQTTDVKEKKIIEDEIVLKYVTGALIEKEYAKIASESGWSSKMIPRLLNTVYHCLVVEESWNFVKEHKNPTIDFKRLMTFTYNRVKQIKPELF